MEKCILDDTNFSKFSNMQQRENSAHLTGLRQNHNVQTFQEKGLNQR